MGRHFGNTDSADTVAISPPNFALREKIGMSDKFDVLVIGEGVAGLTAAGFACETGRENRQLRSKHVLVELVMNITHLEPTPADGTSSGAEYAANLLSSNFEGGVTRFEERVKLLAVNHSGFVASIDSGPVEAPCVVVASGARWKLLGVSGEAEFEGRGVSRCADCDGRLFSRQDVVVVGGRRSRRFRKLWYFQPTARKCI